ncbi:hypothetical protein TD95_004062 [Thielaviopsis punctulata]|uniref:Xylanolytic transcriptional activator regulatory domain-containing protein n=1 Tax=Thielaviopsis punctulata TaxID=72032 RepID=A0A0F4Z9Y7_9PEZI|nr:hypothetical protein TD95_004062 [Thielaviopsis punctulata]
MAVSMYPPVDRPLSTSSIPVAIPRAQVGIDRLPGRRGSNEPREAMNCKSCRKRKVGLFCFHRFLSVLLYSNRSHNQIKCNRLRPSCDACQVFQCECIYDAIPKKRGPKTDVLEALMRRVDGLEAKLKEKRTSPSPENSLSSSLSLSSVTDNPSIGSNRRSSASSESSIPDGNAQQRTEGCQDIEMGNNKNDTHDLHSAKDAVAKSKEDFQPPATEELLNVYFLHFHCRPYYILEESLFRQEFKLGQIPLYLLNAVCAVACLHTPNPDGYGAAVSSSDSFSTKARSLIDIDEPSIYALQALLLLVTAYTAAGKGRKAYMMMTSAVGMAVALELHCEVGTQAHMAPIQRETRRRLFWTCYIQDRFMSCGSKRPSLIADGSIVLRLPSWVPDGHCTPIEGDFFQSARRASNAARLASSAATDGQGPLQATHRCSFGILVGICKILGMTNQYLATGGVKADAHFPWNPASRLVEIVHELEAWHAETMDVFVSIPMVLQRPEATILILSKLVYHTVYCLIYRSFLPVDASEMHRPSQHQTWQIQTTRACLSHADAIVKLVAAGRQARSLQWPAFVASCLCVAATVHIHGSHYPAGLVILDADTAASSSGYLVQELQFLEELRYSWAVVQPQITTLHALGRAHGELVRKYANGPQGVFSDFRLADFFDRYACAGAPKFHFDIAHLSLPDTVAATCAQGEGLVAAPQSSMSPVLSQQRMSSATAPAATTMVSGFYTPQLQTMGLANAAYGCVSPIDDLSPQTSAAFSFPSHSAGSHPHSPPLATAASIIPCTEASMHDSITQAAMIAVTSAGYSLSSEAPLVGADAGAGSFDVTATSYGFGASSNTLNSSTISSAHAAAATGYESLFSFTGPANWADSDGVAAAVVERQQQQQQQQHQDRQQLQQLQQHLQATEKDLELLFAEGLVSSSG